MEIKIDVAAILSILVSGISLFLSYRERRRKALRRRSRLSESEAEFLELREFLAGIKNERKRISERETVGRVDKTEGEIPVDGSA